jgi:N-succinyldiaminopimelate aminotransferase
MRELIDLSDEYGFVIAADECYSEIYADEASPPGGFLAACHAAGRSDFRNVVVFHSLSKRSNLPGLRSGFVAGDADVLDRFLKYRTYQGAALPLPTQKASITAWGDEAHVVAGRALYRQKFARVAREFADHWPIQIPAATFYVWAAAPGGDDCAFARELYAATGVSVLPGSYLSRRVGGQDPGAGWVRLSLVESPEVCADAARRITAFLAGR